MPAGVALGDDSTDDDGVAPDVVGRGLYCNRAREAVHPALRRRVAEILPFR